MGRGTSCLSWVAEKGWSRMGVERVVELPATMFAEAVQLWHETGLTRPWNDPDADLRRAMRGPASTVLFAQDAAAALLGTAMVGHDGHRGWVYYLAVQPALQGRGLGRLLMSACETWLRDRDIPKVQLMVRQDNAAALGFYPALGYELMEVAVWGRRLDR